MPDSVVADLVRKQKAAILRREALELREMTRRWLEVERAMEAELLKTATALAENGGIVTEAMVLRDKHFINLLYRARAEYGKYADEFETQAVQMQTYGLETGIVDAASVLSLAIEEAGLGVSFEMLNVDAINAMIGLTADGTPLRSLLMKSYGDAVNGLTRELLTGLAKGLAPKDVAKAMADGFGVGLDRAMVISRTELLRSYRLGTQEQYRSSEVVTQYKRLAVKDERTCLGCLIQDGEIFENAEDFAEHPNGRCTLVPVVRGAKIPEWESGKTWLQSLPQEKQKAILGNKRFEMFTSGTPLEAFSTLKPNKTWGGAFVPTALKDL